MNLTDVNNKNQTQLYGYVKTFNELSALYIKKKLPKKIIFSGPNGICKNTFSYHLINYIFSLNEKNNYDLKNLKINVTNRSFNLVKSNSHPTFHLIEVGNEKKI